MSLFEWSDIFLLLFLSTAFSILLSISSFYCLLLCALDRQWRQVALMLVLGIWFGLFSFLDAFIMWVSFV